jgi:hypothetical protein
LGKERKDKLDVGMGGVVVPIELHSKKGMEGMASLFWTVVVLVLEVVVVVVVVVVVGVRKKDWEPLF